MKKVFTISTLIAFMILLGFQATRASVPVEEWHVTIDEDNPGGNVQDIGYSVQQTDDGGYIIVGDTVLEGSREVYLVKTDSKGNELWHNNFGGDGKDEGRLVRQTSDGYIIVGTTYSFGNGGQVYLVKTDLNGNKLWENNFGGDGLDEGYSVQQTSDGYIIAGTTSSYGVTNSAVYLVKTDLNGNKLWHNLFDGDRNPIGIIHSCDYATGHSVQQTSKDGQDDGYIIVGGTGANGTFLSVVYLIKTDLIGAQTWAKKYPTDEVNNTGARGIGYSVQQVRQTSVDSGGYIIAGTAKFGDSVKNNVYLIRTDLSGNKIWAENFNYEGESFDEGRSVQQTSDGYIIAGSTIRLGGLGSAVYLIKTNSNGVREWEKTFGDWDWYGKGYSVQQTSDNGYIIVGNIEDPDNEVVDKDVYLLKVILGPDIHVDDSAPGPTHDGTSWNNAYKYLQDALNAAISGDEIWVAEGVYKPDQNIGNPTGTGNRSDTFQLKSGVAVYGGYPGFGEPYPNMPDIQANETILSGDLNKNDVEITDPSLLLQEPTRAENSYHVVTTRGVDATCILDGFTISGGNADGAVPDHCGGGIYNHLGSETNTTCSPTVNNCILTKNSAGHGGGMVNYNMHSSYSDYCNPTLTNCKFIRNGAGFCGGGTHNRTRQQWSSTINGWNSRPTFTNCFFIENWAGQEGGGIYSISSDMVTDCLFNKNRSDRQGGGIWLRSCAEQVLTNCTFLDNSAAYLGGGIYFEGVSRLDVTNCVFSGNTSDRGGGIYGDRDSSYIRLANCTLSGNSAEKGGGILFNFPAYANTYRITNCILWGNSDSYNSGFEESAQIDGHNSEMEIEYCCIQGWSESLGGTGNIADDPLFVDADGPDDTVGTLDDNLRLMSGSPCMDTGDNSAVPSDIADLDVDGDTTEATPFDLDGNPRFVYHSPLLPPYPGYPPYHPYPYPTIPPVIPSPIVPIVDMGAYEFQSQYTNVSVGYLVLIQPLAFPTLTQPATVTFEEVTESGLASLTIGSSGPLPPPGFDHGDPATYYDLATTAVYSGEIEVRIDYSETSFTDESRLGLFHFENDEWVDITSELDTVNDMISGTVTSLSAFAVFELQNRPPVANAGPGSVVSAEDNCTASLTLDGTGSTDPDEDPLTYSWSGVFGTVTGPNPEITLPKGTYPITLTVDDGKGGIDSDMVQITVNDTTGAVPDQDPLAEVRGECSATITSTPTATDNCAGQVVGTTSDPLSYTEQGTYTVTWTYDDNYGNVTTQTQTVGVQDVTPPSIEILNASPDTMWPPNHKMVTVDVDASGSDNCDEEPICRITQVTSNEPEDGLWGGDKAPDWEIIGDLIVNLRAERAGKGSGRIYSITVMCTDASGNSTTSNVNVIVPHDQGKKERKKEGKKERKKEGKKEGKK